MSNNITLIWLDHLSLSRSMFNAINESAHGKEILITTNIEQITPVLQQIDIVIGDFPRELLQSLPNLKWFQQLGTGVEWLSDFSELKTMPFTLTNCSDNHYTVVADQAFALMLSLTRNIPRFVKSQQEKQWDSPTQLDDPSFIQLHGKTVLIVGLGSIGKELAMRCKCFGMRVIGIKRNAKVAIENVEKIFPLNQLKNVVTKVDIVLSCLPNTPETLNIFNSDFFEAMKSTAYFVNVGRGNTVDEDALSNALFHNDIAGAGLDVCKVEPLPKSSLLWDAPNVLITPHMGGSYNEVIQTWIEISIDNLVRYMAGKPLRNIVNKALGY